MSGGNWAVFWGVVGSVLGSLGTVWYLALGNYLKSRRGEFTGEWKQTIPAFDGEPEKIAIVKCRHIGDRLYGTTERISPRTEFVQRWEVEARIKRGLVFGIYWPEDSSKLPGSYGTLQFKIVDETLFEGFYVRARPAQLAERASFVETLRTIPLRWERMFESSVPAGPRE